MNRDEAMGLIRAMIGVAKREIVAFTTSHQLEVLRKADKTLVTACDKHLDSLLTVIAQESGLAVISEEGSHSTEVLKGGNYITIDPIDGTNGYIAHARTGVYPNPDLGRLNDHALLIGIVLNGKPAYAGVLNYVTGETIILEKDGFSRENARIRTELEATYTNGKNTDEITGTRIEQGASGLRGVFSLINPHKNSKTTHRNDSCYLWDVLPTCVATHSTKGHITDYNGKNIQYDALQVPNGFKTNKGETR